MMETDEPATLAALRGRRRDVLDLLVARHQGRIFKVTGDGVLVEFASAVNAVQCAIDLQQGMAAVNVEPKDWQIDTATPWHHRRNERRDVAAV
jgi:adenylate cyclase